jgi:hypothetical protein
MATQSKPTGKAAVTKPTTQEAKAPEAKAENVSKGSAFKLEDGIEIPSRQIAVNKYPFKEMKVGVSFRAPANGLLSKEVATKLGRSVGSAASRYGKTAGKRFTTRVLADDAAVKAKGKDVYFVRCWRIDEK